MSWKHTLKLCDVFHDESLSFEERRDEIVRRVRASRFYDESDLYLTEITDNLGESTTPNDFDATWHDFYDWADFHRVWVRTR